MSAAKPVIAVYGDSREARALRHALAQIDALGAGAAADLHVMAPHPFVADPAPKSAGLNPLVYLRRPGWQAKPGDTWHWVDNPQAAADWLADHRPGPAIIALGNERLAPFYTLHDQILLIRSRKLPHPAPPPMGAVWTQSGPFDIAQEMATLRRYNVTVIIAHDAGGQGGWPKIAAARALSVPVVLLRRPDWPSGLIFESLELIRHHINRTLGLDLPAFDA